MLSTLNNKDEITISDLFDLSPSEFEKLCEKMLKKLEFDHVIVTRISHDQGIDIFADKNDKKYAIQCKKLKYNVDRNKTSWVQSSVVRELVGSVESQYPKFNNKMIIATTCFGNEATEMAKRTDVELVGVPKPGDEHVISLMNVIRQSKVFGDKPIIDPEVLE